MVLRTNIDNITLQEGYIIYGTTHSQTDLKKDGTSTQLPKKLNTARPVFHRTSGRRRLNGFLSRIQRLPT